MVVRMPLLRQSASSRRRVTSESSAERIDFQMNDMSPHCQGRTGAKADRIHRVTDTIFLTRSPTVRGSCCPADSSSV